MQTEHLVPLKDLIALEDLKYSSRDKQSALQGLGKSLDSNLFEAFKIKI